MNMYTGIPQILIDCRSIKNRHHIFIICIHPHPGDPRQWISLPKVQALEDGDLSVEARIELGAPDSDARNPTRQLPKDAK